ncbi:MAG: dihydrolipoyllysine-residue acetyltransferase [Rhodocyclaceae bacterium UTPRO2]|nr:MAG: dihydrolipoyllysine-residue acetyltransferase [Rhodocyclaceae bacterium UTPRO2]
MSNVIEVRVPDIGEFKDVPVIGVEVSPGDTVRAEDALVTLESDKATMEVPSPASGIVKEIRLKIGDKVAEGTLVLLLETAADSPATLSPSPSPASGRGVPSEPISAPQPAAPPAPAEIAAEVAGGHKAHASPSVRRFARELGVDVALVKGTGPKGRILQQDVQAYVKGALAQPRGAAPAAGGGAGLDLLPWPQVDFAKFGPVEAKPLSRIRKISGANLARNWVMIPHVTQFDEADISDLEALRVQLNKENEKAGIKLTLLAFLVKAAVAALKKFPDFNASLDGENLVYKQYFHIGFAADTPNGLVVPVIRDADRKGVLEIAREMGALSARAREGKLGPTEMQGGCFSISSLGGIGGTAFTPIINAPEVAILGVSKSQTKPLWDGQAFQPRLMIPLSLSYDHRVIDGAQAARFTAYLAQLLADMRRVLL